MWLVNPNAKDPLRLSRGYGDGVGALQSGLENGRAKATRAAHGLCCQVEGLIVWSANSG